MDLISSLSIATSGLNAIESELSVTSQNVSNSGTAGYVSETATISSDVPGGLRNGVRIGATQLSINQALQSALYGQNAQVASYSTMSNSLAAVSAVQGSTSSDSGSTNTLSDDLGNVQNALTELTANPLDSASQSTVISNAQSLTTAIHTLSTTYASQRQTAQDNVASTVSSVNSDLTQIGVLSKQIMNLKAIGSDTADLENQRLGIMSDLSSQLSVTFSTTANGDMIVRTADGTELPTRPDQIGGNDSSETLPSSTWPLSTSDATVTSGMYYAAGNAGSTIPGIMLAGTDVTAHLTGGTLGANITLRDDTYPQMQAQLDSFSYTLINRFNNAGLSLFTNGTDATGTTVPQSSNPTQETPNGIVGLSSAIGVSRIYADTPSLLTTTTNGTTGATTTGDTTIITNVLSQAFGTDSNDVSQSAGLAAPSSGLGPDGSQSTGYNGNQGLLALATTLTSAQGATISTASDNLTSATSVQTTLQTSVSNVSGVNVDDEMSKVVALQNAYTANAKVVSAVQSMFTALLDAIN
ncbi:flagellar hook-associated protein FlgK [Nguyenibacter sp. L1]|uniref:flagellar hook-associated protein FlgK n=1 Tax=Nguyenibacter sp. L1 TaxID=3049350 RepID=UPI002B492D1F|nr:flagellar hook-associated protein FlgK [Nguyenibacter sp. L1]WRH89735.1 flagellar hook-associated protein FlgK [Nguyenibacter sp. L1]